MTASVLISIDVTIDEISRLIKKGRNSKYHSVIGWVTKNLLSRVPPCIGRHVKLLVLAAFAVVSNPLQFQGGLTSGRRTVVKIISESLSQHDEKHVLPTPLSVGKG
jgi:hypothetical protein